MFKGLSNTGKIGLIIQALSGVVMGVLALLDKPIPDLLAWLFFVGLIIAIVPDLFRQKK